MHTITLCQETQKDLLAANYSLCDAPSFRSFLKYKEYFGEAVISAEYRDNKNSHKFYRVIAKPNGFFVNWGRVGTNGRNQAVSLEEAERRWKSKLAKGYKKKQGFEGTPFEKAREIRKVANGYQVFISFDHATVVPLCVLPLRSVMKLLENSPLT